MIDKSNEIFTLVANKLREEFEGITVIGESIDVPSKFPTATIDEISNMPIEEDSRPINQYAHVRYRVQVFSNATSKRSEARRIFATIDNVLQQINLKCKSMSTTPEIYNSKIYQITSTYEAIIKEDGTIYRN
jgi:hypothetical protein